MKTRFKNSGREELCKEYPNCNCEGHMVYEKNKSLSTSHNSDLAKFDLSLQNGKTENNRRLYSRTS